MSLNFDVRPNPHPRSAHERAAILANPGFGSRFTEHMAVATWTVADGWHDSAVVPYAPFQLDPAAAILHYAQGVFEGLKAYRHPDGSIWLFRAEENARRFQRSAQRLGLPELPVEAFMESLHQLVSADHAWVPDPDGGEASLYLRPFMFASAAFLGVRASPHVTYSLIASPAGAYFASGVKPVDIWISTRYSRAGAGGTGAAKCGGNYASSLLAQEEAAQNGCAQVLVADAGRHEFVEEFGGMNICFVRGDELVTPALTGSILEGVTRASIVLLAAMLGLRAVERPVGRAELLEGIGDRSISEVFACGTAAVITPISGFADESGRTYRVAGGEVGEHTSALRQSLLDLQFGRAEDVEGWLTRVR